MSYENDECKLLIDEAIHEYLHDDTETEMTVKDWFYDLRKQAAKADEYKVNLNEVKKQLKIQIRHARRDGDYSEASALSEALDMIENLL